MPEIKIRWADNTAELTKNLKQGHNQIEATKASAEKMVQALRIAGDSLNRVAGPFIPWDGPICDRWIERAERLLGGLFTKRKAARW